MHKPLKGPSTNVFGFKEDEVEWRKALYTNRDATKVSTRGAPSPELREVLQDAYTGNLEIVEVKEPPCGFPSKFPLSLFFLWNYFLFLHSKLMYNIITVEQPLTDTSRRQTTAISRHSVMISATYKHYIFNLP